MPTQPFRVSVLDDVGDPDAQPGSEPWAKWMVGQAHLRRHDLQRSVKGLQEILKKLDKNSAWKALGFLSLGALCSAKLDLDEEQVNLILKANPDITLETVLKRQQAAQQAARENTEPLAPDGGDRKSAAMRAARENTEPISENQSLEKKKENSDSARSTGSSSYRVRKLRRDNPEAAERLAAGEFKSVAAAVRWSNGEEPHPPRQKKTELEWLQHWWDKADEETRSEFIKWTR